MLPSITRTGGSKSWHNYGPKSALLAVFCLYENV